MSLTSGIDDRNVNDEWMLFDRDCPSTSQGRGFIRGEMYTHDGRLAASVAQECLMRVKPPA